MNLMKLLALSIIGLFIGVAIAPSINTAVVKASTDNDLVEVSSQAYGISGFGNTTVKLTNQQYQELQKFLVDFRTRLNQTTTREEAIPIFKEAVVELNKYRLLPQRMSVRQAQRLIKPYETVTDTMYKASSIHSSKRYTNLFCLIAGKATYCTAANLMVTTVKSIISYLYFQGFPGFFGELFVVWAYLGILLAIRNYIGVLDVLSLLTFGGINLFGYPFPAVGWIYTAGLQGTKNQTGSLFGKIPYPVKDVFGTLYTGVFGFTGFKIICPDHSWLFFGTALWVNISDSLHDTIKN